MRTATSRLALLFAIVATVGCDRVTKHLATESLAGEPGRSYLGHTISLEYAENQSGFLSIGAHLPPGARTAVFTVGSGLMLLTLIGAAAYLHWSGSQLMGAGFILAGGASNWIDRVMRGSVVDFINVGIGPLRTGIFNFADVAIVLGITVLLCHGSRPHSLSKNLQHEGAKSAKTR